MISYLKQKFKFIRSITLSVQFFILGCVLILIIGLSILTVGFIDYQSYKENQEAKLANQTTKLSDKMNYIFSTIERMNIYLGKQISQVNPKDLNSIYNIFFKFTETRNSIETMFSWVQYGWIDANGISSIYVKTGINRVNPPNLSFRKYYQESKIAPWTLKLEGPLNGIPSGQKLVIAATGVTDKTGKYIGTINVGLTLASLKNELDALTNRTNTEYFIANESGEILFYSSHNNSLKKISLSLLRLIDDTGAVLNDKSINTELANYNYAQKIGVSKFYVFVGNNKLAAKQELNALLLSRIIEFIGISLICMILLLAFRFLFINPISKLANNAESILGNNPGRILHIKSHIREITYLNLILFKVKKFLAAHKRNTAKLTLKNMEINKKNLELAKNEKKLKATEMELKNAITAINKSTHAKELFMKQLNVDLKTPINTIITELVNIYKITKPTYSFAKIKASIEQAYDATQELLSYSCSKLNLETTNIRDIIEESLLINQKALYDKKLTLHLDITSDLPAIKVDIFKLKQAFAALIYRSISCTPSEGSLQIKCATSSLKAKNIEITISDSGFGLDEENFNRLKEKFDKNSGLGGLELTLKTIRKIIEMHQGKIFIEHKVTLGTLVRILLPLQNHIFKNEDNIYYLFNKK